MKKLRLLLLLPVLTLALTACTSYSANSWSGLTIQPNGETLYLANNTHVYALEARSGALRWAYPEKPNPAHTFFAPPALTADEQLILGGYDNTLYSINPANGQPNPWSFKAENRFIGGILTADETIYAPVANGHLYALNTNGQPIWQNPFRSDYPLWSKPILSENGESLYISGMDKHLYALNPQDGSIQWKTDLNGSAAGTPALVENTLYQGTFNNEVIALNSQTGEIIWRAATSGWVWATPAVTTDTIYVGDLNGTFYAFNRSNGEIRWQLQPDGPIAGEALVYEGKIYLGTESGSVYILSSDGKIEKTLTFQGRIYAPIQQTNGLILIAPSESDTLLIALNPDGSQAWAFTPEK
ncbi:MAG: hypothetical protein OHK0052_01960 [Anaerolineales bacterium]